MKWFKHMTDTRRREDITKLLNERSGTMLFGIYCLILETVADQMDIDSDCCEVTYPIKEWAEIAHVDVRTFTRFLQVCSELADFMYEKNYKLVTIRIDNLLKLQDDTTRKLRKQKRHKSGLDIEQTGLNADASRPTPPEHSLRSCSAPRQGAHTSPEVPPREAPSDEEITYCPSPPSKTIKRAARFVKPTLEEVTAYCKERNNTVNPQRFIDHYESNGWMVGKNKMKDWRAAVRTWENNNYNGSSKSNSKSSNGGVTAAEADKYL